MPPPASAEHHLFLSYSREDDKGQDGSEGWVTAFEKDLRRRYREYTGRDLRIFFDKEAIDPGRDWRRELGIGLRSARLFLAFLTPNYLASKNTIWEWNEYLRREHSSARGDDGLTPIYFVQPGRLKIGEEEAVEAWLRERQAECPWFPQRDLDASALGSIGPLIEDLRRRQRGELFELWSWAERGPVVLSEIDAGERSEEAKAAGRDPAEDQRSLADRLAALQRHIAHRIDRIALADLAPGNTPRAHEHFVGRHGELRKLHDIMMRGGGATGGRGMGGRGMIAATFSPGGLGKTALARQYSHAYAEYFAAGGTWELACEGAETLGEVLLRLAEDSAFRRMGSDVGEVLELSKAASEEFDLAARAVFEHLGRVTAKRAETVAEALRSELDRHSPDGDLPALEAPRALLVLDNVSERKLLSASQLALLPAEEWLEVIVTTRLDPGGFGGGDNVFESLEVPVLPEEDALELLAEFQPGRSFADGDEVEAARKIVRALDGWTLAVELVGAFIGDRARRGASGVAQAYLKELETRGLDWVDDLTSRDEVHEQQRHRKERRENRIAEIVRWSVERLSEPARAALEYASLLQPDSIPMSWILGLTARHHPEVADESIDNDHAWPLVWSELYGLRLLHPSKPDDGVDGLGGVVPSFARIHRLVAEHVEESRIGLRQRIDDLDELLERLGITLQPGFGSARDAGLPDIYQVLRNQLEFLLERPEVSTTRLKTALVVAQHATRHEPLAGTIEFTIQIHEQVELLARSHPQSAGLRRLLSISGSELADNLAKRGAAGDSDAAFSHYVRSLKVAEASCEYDRESTDAARDLSTALSDLGTFLARRNAPGDDESAFQYFTRSLAISESLYDDDSTSMLAARDVSQCLTDVGNLLARRGDGGDGGAALDNYLRALAIKERLYKANSTSTDAARDLSVGLNKVAYFLAQRGDPRDCEAAVAHYRRSLEIREGLYEARPTSAEAALDLAQTLRWLADLLSQSSSSEDLEASLTCQARACALTQKLWEGNEESWHAARAHAMSLYSYAQLLMASGERKLAVSTLLQVHGVLRSSADLGLQLDEGMRMLLSKLVAILEAPE